MGVIESIITAFPEHPLPQSFLVDADGPRHDMAEVLASRIQGRAWRSLSMLDWRMVGPVPAFREYVLPPTFAYYLPSLLVGGIAEPDFRDWALEAILPPNRWREPRGEWWAAFAAAISDPQRKAIKAFLAFQRDAGTASLDIADEELVSSAERLWA